MFSNIFLWYFKRRAKKQKADEIAQEIFSKFVQICDLGCMRDSFRAKKKKGAADCTSKIAVLCADVLNLRDDLQKMLPNEDVDVYLQRYKIQFEEIIW